MRYNRLNLCHFLGQGVYSRKSVCLFVCLSVLYAFRHSKSYHHYNFHDAFLGPGEGT